MIRSRGLDPSPEKFLIRILSGKQDPKTWRKLAFSKKPVSFFGLLQIIVVNLDPDPVDP
jgi:hypothetical protein